MEAFVLQVDEKAGKEKIKDVSLTVDNDDFPPITRQLSGILRVPPDFDWKEERANGLMDKYFR